MTHAPSRYSIRADIGTRLQNIATRLIVLTVFACAAYAGDVASAKSDAMLVLEVFAPSPDGRVVAFQYHDLSAGQNDLGLGFLDLQSGKLTRIPNPPGKQLSEPSFSRDGKRLAAAMGNLHSLAATQITIIDPATLKTVTTVNPNPWEVAYPVFQPGSDNVLFVATNPGVPKQLRLLDLANNDEHSILDPAEGFYTIFQPSFVGPDDVLFQAMSPRDLALKQSAVDLLGKDRYDPALRITYRLHFGERPEIFLPELTRSRTGPLLPGIPYLTASRDGETIAFIGLSIADPYNEHHQYNYEVFALRNGQERQMTNLRSLLAYAHISFDGMTVAFGSDPTRRKIVDLFVLDMRSGKVTATGLLNKLQSNPEFRLR